MRKPLVIVLFSCAISLGCTGAIDGESTQSTAPDRGGGTGGGGGGPAAPSPDTGLWRLTRTEYNNTLRDLLGDTTQAGNALALDFTFHGFDNNAQILNRSAPPIDKYDQIASDVIENALRAGSAVRKRLLGACDPVAEACARPVLSDFARRAWRRPVEDPELDELMAALAVARAQGDGPEEGVKLAFRMALASPSFTYRIELDPAKSMGLHPVSPYELATRLSYFVWSTMPDDELLARAEDGTLGHPPVFAAQMARMLASPKAAALVDNFAGQWLGTRRLADIAVDKKTFPTFDDSLRKAMATESQLFFKEFLGTDRNLVDMLDAGFTFANDRLAKHYGLGGVTSMQPRQVSLDPSSDRFGLLSQGSLLTVTSNPNRTNVPKRGKWILSSLLCAPPGDPPANVPPLPEDPKMAGLPANATIRQRLASHLTTPSCVGCHSTVDPLGFALEHYDGIGKWRASYPGGVAIDATGKLADGTFFDGALELSRALKQDPRFVSCFTETVFAYALGREPSTGGDRDAIDRLVADLAGRGGRIRELIALTASGPAFQLRGGIR